MSIEYRSAVIFVTDMGTSRRFYEDLMEQDLEFDFGANVSYVGGLALWQVDHAHEIVFGPPPVDGAPSAGVGQGELELYFETDDLDAVVKLFEEAGVAFVHPLREQPWGQRVIRVYDPDGHIVEVGEPIPVFVARFLTQGMSVEQAAERTSVPLETVRQIAETMGCR
jgi:catechol 2,3-dioxygenase-like lactoylglutathione lyase family enzyme